MRRDKWDELYAKFKAQTDQEHDEVVALGGLHIVATERHESRRIDNQLRGRAGRQGDPGSSRFFLSLQDDLLRIFGGERMQNLMLRLGMEEDVPIESKLITKRIAKAQEAVEVQNFEARKHLLEYDDVMNKQRQAVYGMRRQLLEGIDQKERVNGNGARHCRPVSSTCAVPKTSIPTRGTSPPPQRYPEHLRRQDRPCRILAASPSTGNLPTWSSDRLQQKYQEKEDLVGADIMRQTERIVMLQVIDNQWKDHLLSMDELKQGIGNRAYGQKDPLVEYKKESYELFTAMMDRIEDETVRYLFFLQVNTSTGPVLPFPTKTEEEEQADEANPARMPASSSARPPRARWRTSRAISSARRTRSCRTSNSAAAMAPPPRSPSPWAKGGPQRSVPLRQRQEIQEVPRGVGSGRRRPPAPARRLSRIPW